MPLSQARRAARRRACCSGQTPDPQEAPLPNTYAFRVKQLNPISHRAGENPAPSPLRRRVSLLCAYDPCQGTFSSVPTTPDPENVPCRGHRCRGETDISSVTSVNLVSSKTSKMSTSLPRFLAGISQTLVRKRLVNRSEAEIHFCAAATCRPP